MSTHEKVFNIINGEVSFDHSQLEYYFIRKQFKDLASESRSEILADFYNRFDSFYAMAANLQQYLKEYLNKGALLCAQVMAARDHYELDPDRFIEEFFDASRMNEASQRFRDFVQSQQDESEANEAERCARTEALGNAWEGGGFGLEGAIKGAVQAEALNLAGAAVSGMFNAAGRKMEAERQQAEQKAFFEDPATAEAFADGVYNALADMYIDLFNYVDKNCPEIQIKRLTSDDISKAKALLSNIQKGIIPEEKAAENCRKILTLNPLFSEAYEFILVKYPESKDVILEMDDYFCIGVIRKKMFELLDEFFTTVPVDTEEKAWAAHKIMQDKASDLGINDFTTYPQLEKIIKDFDIAYRTFEGVTYPTRELADKYKALSSFYKTLPCDTEENALKARQLMADKAAELALDEYSAWDELEAIIAEFDRQAKIIAGRIFETREEAAAQSEAYDIYKSSDFLLSEENAKTALNNLQKLAQKHQINVSWLTEDVEVALKHFDEEKRIAFEYMYDSREEAQSAAATEDLFFRAVWSVINRNIQSGKLFKKSSASASISSVVGKLQSSIKGQESGQEYSQDVISTARTSCGLADDEQLFAYISNEVIPSGKVGIAITNKGVIWNNGSALLTQIAGSKLLGRFMAQKAEQIKEQNQVKTFKIKWFDLLTSSTEISLQGSDKLLFPNGEILEASNIDAKQIADMFSKFRNWVKEYNIKISDSDKMFDRELLRAIPKVTELPQMK